MTELRDILRSESYTGFIDVDYELTSSPTRSEIEAALVSVGIDLPYPTDGEFNLLDPEGRCVLVSYRKETDQCFIINKTLVI